MTDHGAASGRNASHLLIGVALLASVLLLGGILFMLVSISLNGISIRLGGDISLSDASDRIAVDLVMAEPIVLSMPQPAQLVAAGPEGGAIPAALSLVTCPECGGSMLPSKWNPWTGEIGWTCPACERADAGSDAREDR